jgi:hypothetical protein
LLFYWLKGFFNLSSGDKGIVLHKVFALSQAP